MEAIVVKKKVNWTISISAGQKRIQNIFAKRACYKIKCLNYHWIKKDEIQRDQKVEKF